MVFNSRLRNGFVCANMDQRVRFRLSTRLRLLFGDFFARNKLVPTRSKGTRELAVESGLQVRGAALLQRPPLGRLRRAVSEHA
jgi:hypothetical protein